MVSGESTGAKKQILKEGQSSHAHYLLLSLSRAAQAIQQAHTAEDFYIAVGREINQLGGEVTLLLLDEAGTKLSIAYTSYSPKLISRAEKLTGLSLKNYKLPIPPESAYEVALQGESAIFIGASDEIISDILPDALAFFSAQLISLFNLRQGILAPLRVDKKVLGLLKVNGNFLNLDDLPAMESFAGHIAAGLHNVHLMQKLQEELTAHKQTEQALQHNRNLLLALSQAAHAIQLVRMPDDIYKVVGEQIRALGFEATILKFGSDMNSLHYRYTTIPEKVLHTAEKLAGIKAEDFGWAISQDSVYARVLINRKAEYISNGKALFIEALPKFLLPLAEKLVDLVSSHHGILAPLHVDDETFGIMLVFGSDQISEEDVPAVESFSAQVSVSLRNAYLTQRLQRELHERKQAEAAAQQAEKRFKALIENAPDGITLVGGDGKATYASPSAKEMFGYIGDEYTNENPMDSIHPDDIGAVLATMNDLVGDSSSARTVQYRYRHQDGSYHWVESTFSNQFAEPAVEAIVVNFRDITERKEMERALYESERYYRALIENTADGILVIDGSGVVTYESPSVARLLGYGQDKLIGTSSFNLIHPDDLSEILKTFVDGLNSPGFVHRGEYRLLNAENNWRYFEIVTHYLMDDPAIMGVIINGRDITERKQSESALKESERKFHGVIDKSADGIALSDEEGRILEFNEAFEQLTGKKRENVLGKFLWELAYELMPDSTKAVDENFTLRNRIQQALKIGATSYFQFTQEVPFQRADGSVLIIQQRIFTIRTDKGCRLGSISRDITEIKKVEEYLTQQNKQLNSLYQITSALSQINAVEDIYAIALDSLCSTLDIKRVSILLFDRDGVMRFKAWRGLSDRYRRAAEGHSPWKPDAVDPQPVLVEDAFNDAELASLYDLFKSEGISALGFIPLVHQNKLLGKFMIYFDAPHHFLETEVRLAQAIASHVAFAIHKSALNEALRTNEEQYRILYEDNPSIYFTTDDKGTILSVNKTGVEQLGYAIDELIGSPLLDIFYPDDREHVLQKMLACINDPEKTVQVEARKQRKDKSILWVREFARAIRNTDGHLVILIVCNNVTEEVKAEEALVQSEAELRALFSSMKDSVIVIDRNGIYQSVAPTNPETLYIPPAEVIGKGLSAFFPEEQVQEFLKAIEYVLATGKTVIIEYQIILAEVSPWFESRVSPLGPDTTIWVARDVSERKKIQSALIQSEQAYRSLFENMPIGLYRSSIHGELLDANPSLLRMFGYEDLETMKGKKAWEFYNDPALDDKFRQQISENGFLNRYESEFIRQDGTRFWAEDYVRAVYDGKGTPLYYEGSLIDVTDRKAAEKRLKESEKQYRLLAERIADVVWVLDLVTLEFKYISSSVQNLLGHSAEELLNKHVSTVLTPSAMMAIESITPERIKRFLAGDKTSVTELYQLDHVHKDGSIIVVEVSSTFVMNENATIEAIGVTRNITERKKAEDDLRLANSSLQIAHKELQQLFEYEQILARTDGLTRLYNRRYFFELAAREFNSAIRYQRPLTLIIFDVDGFKQANDTFGHDFGDRTLVEVSKTANLQVREVDILARYGGDEFTILLPETNVEQAFLIAERIRKAVADVYIDMGGFSTFVTISMGISELSFEPQDQSIEDMIRRADQALYQAKQQGRNKVVIYSDK